MVFPSPFDLDGRMLPDTADACWGPGYGPGSRYDQETLDEFAQWVSETRQPGYGPRLHADSPGWIPADARGSRCQVPAGYDATGHPNRADVDPATMDAEIPTTTGETPRQVPSPLQDLFAARGWVLDQHGRPMHPHHEQLLDDPRIGLPANLGFGYFYGETAVADAVVSTSGGLVLVGSRDTDRGRIPCLPGGYTEPADFGRSVAQWRAGDRPLTRAGIYTAAVREVAEETGLVVPRSARPWIVRAIRPISSPHTAHAWTCTYTVHIHLDTAEPPPAPGGRWVDIDELLADWLPRMWPDHRRAILAALDEL